MICLCETWLSEDTLQSDILLDDYDVHINSVGPGKGLVTYFRKDKFKFNADVKCKDIQITKIVSESFDVLNMYRSSDCSSDRLLTRAMKLIDPQKTTLICEDVNICYIEMRHDRFVHGLENFGFKQCVKQATHLKGGLIDHAYLWIGDYQLNVDVTLYSPYYCAKDHDALLIDLYENK